MSLAKTEAALRAKVQDDLEVQGELAKTMGAKDKSEERVARVETELEEVTKSKASLAQSVSQLITDTNAMKDQVRQEQLNAQKQKEVYKEEARKEREELKSLLAVSSLEAFLN